MSTDSTAHRPCHHSPYFAFSLFILNSRVDQRKPGAATKAVIGNPITKSKMLFCNTYKEF